MAHNPAHNAQEFLKRKGLQSDFNTRQDIFNRFGLGNQLGDFKGSTVQNDAIANQLTNAEKNAGVNINANNLEDILRTNETADAATLAGLLGPSPEPDAFAQAGITAQPGSAEATQQILARGQALISQPSQQPITTPTTAPTTAPTAPTTALQTAETTPPIADFDPQSLLPESQVAQLTPEGLAEQALERVTGAATFPLVQEAQTAKKAATALSAQRETESFIKNIASRGLFFSGQKKEGVATIEADKLAELLNIDRSFALLLTQGIETAAQNIAKEAQKGDANALDALEAAGFTVVNGQVVPTLQARKAIATEERAQVTEERQERQFQLSIIKTEEQQRQFEATQSRLISQFLAKQEEPSITITSVGGRRVAIDKKTNQIVKDFGPVSTSETDEFTKGEQRALKFEDIRSRAAKRLTDIAINSDDNFTNTDEFIKFRNEVRDTVPTFIDDFDKAFGPLLNPADAAKRGLTLPDIDPFESVKLRTQLREQK